MPLYKCVGNRILTTRRERVLGRTLTEFHSGYRAYSVDAPRARSRSSTTPTASTSTRRSSSSSSAGQADRGDPDPDLLRRRDLLRERHEVRQGRRQGRDRVQLAAKGFGTQEWVARRRRVPLQGGRRHLARGPARDAGQAAAVAGSWTSAAPAGCSPSELRARGHHVTGVDIVEMPGGARPGRPVRPGRPRRRAPGRGRRRLRRRRRRRRDRAPAAARRAAERTSGQSCARAASHAALGAELRPLVPAGARRAGTVRLRPARHPRRHPPALLHPVDAAPNRACAGFDIVEERATGLPLGIAATTRTVAAASAAASSTLPWSGCARPCSATSTSFASYRTPRRPSSSRAVESAPSGRLGGGPARPAGLTRGQHQILGAEHQPEPSAEDVDPLVPLMGLRAGQRRDRDPGHRGEVGQHVVVCHSGNNLC